MFLSLSCVIFLLIQVLTVFQCGSCMIIDNIYHWWTLEEGKPTPVALFHVCSYFNKDNLIANRWQAEDKTKTHDP